MPLVTTNCCHPPTVVFVRIVEWHLHGARHPTVDVQPDTALHFRRVTGGRRAAQLNLTRHAPETGHEVGHGVVTCEQVELRE